MSQNLIGSTQLLPKVLCSTQLADTADHAIYTVPSATGAIIKHAAMCNTTGSPVVITAVAVVPSGGSVDGTHRVISGFTLGANDSATIDELIGCCLGPGDAIHAQALTGGAVNFVISGTENN